MQNKSSKELTPVVYGESAVRVLHFKLHENEYGFSSHWHDRFELHLVKQGSLILTLDGRQTKVKAGEISVIAPEIAHEGKAGENGVEYYCIMFDVADLDNGTVAAARFIRPIISGDLRFLDKTDDESVINAAERLAQENFERKNNPLQTVGELYSLLGLLCEICALPMAQSKEKSDADSVLSYINKHFAEEISVGSMSRLFGYDEAYFCRKFKKENGQTLMAFVNRLRLERASELLISTKYNIRNIALTCGFSDVAYFCNCFKRAYSMTPTEYRKAHLLRI